MEKEMCILYDRECIDCGECDICDLDPNKFCDSCGKCLELGEYASIKITKILQSDDEVSDGDFESPFGEEE